MTYKDVTKLQTVTMVMVSLIFLLASILFTNIFYASLVLLRTILENNPSYEFLYFLVLLLLYILIKIISTSTRYLNRYWYARGKKND